MLLFIFQSVVILLCFEIYPRVSSQGVPLSPCPRTFWYENDGLTWYGIIEIGPPYQRDLILKVHMDIGINLPTSYVGRVELLGERSQLILNIVNRRKIRYQVHFPVLDALPIVTKIVFNNKEICSGSRLNANTVTSINLRHVLNTNLNDDFDNYSNSNIDKGYENVENINNKPEFSSYNKYNFENNQNNVATTVSPPRRFYQQRLEENGAVNRQTLETPSQSNLEKPFEEEPSNQYHKQKGVDEQEKNFHQEERPNPDTFASFSNRPSVTYAPMVSTNAERNEVSNMCGIPRNVNPLIVGGESTRKGDWPWLVAIFVKKVSSLNFICGATLVSKDTIITAAHCMLEKNNRPVKKEEVVVKLGMFNLQDWTDEDTKTLAVKQIISHPSYDGGLGLRNDIAILKINKVSFTTFILPSCMWTENLDTKSYIGKYGVAVGWGRDENGLIASPEPRLVRQKLVSLDECRESNTAFVFLTSNTTFCAGNRDGTGPCNGDSGGGLFLYVDGKWRLRGIVSSSLNDPSSKNVCDLSYFIIYTDIDKFLPWINYYL